MSTRDGSSLGRNAPPVLRRTRVGLPHKAGAAIEPISPELDHVSVEINQICLCEDLPLRNAPSDHMDLPFEVRPQRLDVAYSSGAM